MAPDVRVIVSSGHDAEECRRTISDPRVVEYLQKPYTPNVLLDHIGKALAHESMKDGRPASAPDSYDFRGAGDG
jgi:DNA-binding NtrC family response regulator